MKTVQFIPAIPKLELPKRLRVAAYCRVSTMQEIQCHSLETQRDYYKSTSRKNVAGTLSAFIRIKRQDGITKR